MKNRPPSLPSIPHVRPFDWTYERKDLLSLLFLLLTPWFYCRYVQRKGGGKNPESPPAEQQGNR